MLVTQTVGRTVVTDFDVGGRVADLATGFRLHDELHCAADYGEGVLGSGFGMRHD